MNLDWRAPGWQIVPQFYATFVNDGAWVQWRVEGGWLYRWAPLDWSVFDA